MAIERHKMNRPVGDEDLTGGRDREEVNIRDGGVGPSGSGFSSTGRIGGLGNTSDGMHARTDPMPGASDDHTMDGSNVIDTNLTPTGVNPDASGDADEDRRDGE
jgi:hypothetical protein